MCFSLEQIQVKTYNVRSIDITVSIVYPFAWVMDDGMTKENLQVCNDGCEPHVSTDRFELEITEVIPGYGDAHGLTEGTVKVRELIFVICAVYKSACEEDLISMGSLILRPYSIAHLS